MYCVLNTHLKLSGLILKILDKIHLIFPVLENAGHSGMNCPVFKKIFSSR